MNTLRFKSVFTLVLAVAFLFIACDRDDDDRTKTPTPPISNGASVTINNTFQSTAFGIDDETPIEAIFQVPEGSLFATANVGEGLEFDDYLLTLYDVDIAEDSIIFTLVAPADSETYSSNFRTIEAGTVDRYYLNFDSAQNVQGSTSSDASVSLIVDSPSTLVVEITEGFNFNPGTTFTITLE